MSERSVDAAMSSQTKSLMTASVIESSAECESNQKKAKGLTNKVMKMKEDITREVLNRVTAMADREERAVLMTAVSALKKSDSTRALKVLEERLLQLSRRVQQRNEESSSDDSSDERNGDSDDLPKPQGKTVEVGEDDSNQITSKPEFCPPSCVSADWESLAEGQLTASCRPDCNGRGWGLAQSTHCIRSDLDEQGYFLGPDPPEDAHQLASQVMKGMEALRRAGVPSFYIWMFDEPWEIMLRLWQHAEEVLQGPVVLEPTFAAYHLDYSTAAKRGNRYNGTNFALPHRDYTFSDSFDTAGRPKVLTVWIPVSEVRADNGCMYVVPKEFDEYRDRDDVQEHMLVQNSGWLKGKSFLSFPLAAVRALAPAKAATVMGWAGNTIHWGSQCHKASADCPRASIAWVFKRADAPHQLDVTPVSRDGAKALTLAHRRTLIESSMAFFKHWSTVEQGPWSGVNTNPWSGGMGPGGGMGMLAASRQDEDPE